VPASPPPPAAPARCRWLAAGGWSPCGLRLPPAAVVVVAVGSTAATAAPHPRPHRRPLRSRRRSPEPSAHGASVSVLCSTHLRWWWTHTTRDGATPHTQSARRKAIPSLCFLPLLREMRCGSTLRTCVQLVIENRSTCGSSGGVLSFGVGQRSICPPRRVARCACQPEPRPTRANTSQLTAGWYLVQVGVQHGVLGAQQLHARWPRDERSEWSRLAVGEQSRSGRSGGDTAHSSGRSGGDTAHSRGCSHGREG
jgi:hypothetical protein